MVGEKLLVKLVLPGGLIKYLGVFLGEESVLEKNWENALEKIDG